MTNIYYILFPPWAGGNHLGNMLCLSNRFTDNKPFDFIELLEFYNSNNNPYFHYIYSRELNLKKEDYKIKLIEKLNQNNASVHTGGHFGWLMEFYPILAAFGDVQVILLDMPDRTASAGKRMLTERSRLFRSQQLVNDHYFSDQYLLYNTNTIHKLLDIPLNSIIDVSTDLFNSVDTPVFSQLNDRLNLELPLDQCNKLHNIWMKKIHNV
jgi:hypothetical protein